MKIGSTVEIDHDQRRVQGVVTSIDKNGNVGVKVPTATGYEIVNRARDSVKVVKAGKA